MPGPSGRQRPSGDIPPRCARCSVLVGGREAPWGGAAPRVRPPASGALPPPPSLAAGPDGGHEGEPPEAPVPGPASQAPLPPPLLHPPTTLTPQPHRLWLEHCPPVTLALVLFGGKASVLGWASLERSR